MTINEFAVWGVIAIIITYIVLIYNNLITLKHNVSKALANIDVLLKQRYDELPKLVTTCKEYMKFEQETLEKVIQARSLVAYAQDRGDITALGKAEGIMRSGLNNLFAVAEAYPELKANETFQHLQARITGLEDAIADRREYYNESVNNNNVQIELFPVLVIARLFRFKPFELLEFDPAGLRDVNIEALFKS